MRLKITILPNELEASNAWFKANIDREGGEYTFGESQLSASGVFTPEQETLIRVQFADVVEE